MGHIQFLNQDGEWESFPTAEEEENMNKEILPEDLPILPLRNNVLFPEPFGPMMA